MGLRYKFRGQKQDMGLLSQKKEWNFLAKRTKNKIQGIPKLKALEGGTVIDEQRPQINQ